MQTNTRPSQDDCDSDTDIGIPILDNSGTVTPSDRSSDADVRIPVSDIPDCDRPPKYDPYAYTSPERDRVAPGQPPQKSGNRIVKIETASDLMAEIRWCLSDGGYFTLHRSFVAPPKVGYFLEHRAYNDGERQVKTALARELIEQKAIRSDDPTKGPGSGHREFYIWDDRAFPSNSESDIASQLSETETFSESAIAGPEQDTALQSASQLSDKSTPEFPEWMTAKQAFEFLGGNPGDRNSSVSSVDGLKQIRFSTFKSKTSSELKPFKLELSQDRKRQRQPCYRSLKPK